MSQCYASPKSLFDLQKDPEETKEHLKKYTLNNIIKASLAGKFPSWFSEMGLTQDESDKLMHQIHVDMGMPEVIEETWKYAKKQKNKHQEENKKSKFTQYDFDNVDENHISKGKYPESFLERFQYPFFKPFDPDILEKSSRTSETLGDIVREIVKSKYTDIGKRLAYNEFKLGSVYDKTKPSYMVFVSNEMDLLRVLVGIAIEEGDFEIDSLPQKRFNEKPELYKEYLPEDSQAHKLYQKLKKNDSKKKTIIETQLEQNNMDAVVVVSPHVTNGVKIRLYKSLLRVLQPNSLILSLDIS
ncbi:hypothetical protein GF327_06790 [Candidatus Woesearchaeota archaeon]|nr:hypothetical protein [Candidatus Woesearchaeota archaeon]